MLPEQNVVAPDAVMLAVGVVLTVTTLLAVAVHPPVAAVTVTVYVPVALSEIAAVVAAVLHRYVPPPVAVRVTLPGEQKVVAPDAVIPAVGVVFTVTALLAVAVQPIALVTVTV